MKKRIYRIAATLGLCAGLIAVPNVAYAAPTDTPSSPDQESSPDSLISGQLAYFSKLTGKPVTAKFKAAYEKLEKEYLNKNGSEKVRVMVLLKGQPHGKGDQSANLSQVNSVISRLKSKYNLDVKRTFGLLIKGFSAVVKRSDMESIALDPDVKSIAPVQKFYPSMTTAAPMLQGPQSRKKYGADGSGEVIAIVDTGIDIHHQDMKIDKDKLKNIKIKPWPGFTDKVPFGYNFADKDDVVKPENGCSPHGMHVAGIVAANGDEPGKPANAGTNGRIDGMAPNAQLLAMKVFSNLSDKGSASEDDIVAAIEKSVQMGADVINMSLGSDNGFGGQEGEGEARAIKNAKAAGVQVVVAAGNAGRNFTQSGEDGSEDPSFLDDGTVGDPATAPGALAVASINNASIAYQRALVKIDGKDADPVAWNLQVGTPDEKTFYQVVDAGFGRPEDVKNLDLTGKLALISRGDISFADKFKDATNKGAAAVLVYNNKGNNPPGMGGIDGYTNIVGGGIPTSDAQIILKQLKAGKKVEIDLTNGIKETADKDTGWQPSSFSSWGTSTDLSFKPEIAGIGGNVYSTLPDNKYGLMSGTSMATPSISGVTALLLQVMKKNPAFAGLSRAQMDNLARVAMSNTASILKQKNKVPYTPRLIGAGLAQTEYALSTKVFATVDGSPNVALKAFTGSKSFTVNLHNYGDKAQTYTVGTTCPLNEVVEDTSSHTVCSKSDTVATSEKTVTVPAKGDASVSVNVSVGSTNHWVSGWVTFVDDKDHSVPELHVPYMGFAGDWNHDKIFADPGYTSLYLKDLGIAKGVNIANPALTDAADFFMQMNFFPSLMTADAGLVLPYDPSFMAINPANGDMQGFLTPRILLQRNVTDLKGEILDSKGNVVRVTGEQTDLNRFTLATFVTNPAKTDLPALKFDGKVWDSQKAKYVPIADGKYTFRILGRVNSSEPYQHQDFHFVVDSVAPVIKLVSMNDNNDGSATVEVKVTNNDSYADNYAPWGLIAGSTKQLNSKKLDNGDYQFYVPDAQKAEHLRVAAHDTAGNISQLLVPLSDVPYVVDDYQLTGHINGQGIMHKDGTVGIFGIASPDTATMKIAGTDMTYTVDQSGVVGDLSAKKPRGYFQFTVKPKPGPNTYNLQALDSQGNVLATKKIHFVLDTTAPVVHLTNPAPGKCINIKMGKDAAKQPNAYGTIDGTVTDDYADPFVGGVQNQGIHSAPMTFTKDGKFHQDFSIPAAVKPMMIHMIVSDGANQTIVGIPVCDVAGMKDGPFYDPSTWNAGASVNNGLVFPTLKDDLVKNADGTYIFKFKGSFFHKPDSFRIGTWNPDNLSAQLSDITIKKDLSFEKDLKVVPGINKFYYEMSNGGKKLAAGTFRVFVDTQIPAIKLDNPKPARDGVVYLQKPGDLTFQGSVKDDEFGFDLFIDGQHVTGFESIWDPNADQKLKRFAYTVPVKNGDEHVFEVDDLNGNYYTRTFPITVDGTAPTVDLEGITANTTYNADKIFNVRVSDPNLDNASVAVDGKTVDSKSVDYKLSDRVWDIYNGDVAPGSNLKPLPGDTAASATPASVENNKAKADSTKADTKAKAKASDAKAKSTDNADNAKKHVATLNKAMSNANVVGNNTLPKVIEFHVQATDMTPGAHTITVKSRDLAGNETTKQVSFFINHPAPTIEGPDTITLDPAKNLADQIKAAYKAVSQDGTATLYFDIKGIDTKNNTLLLAAVDNVGQKVTRLIHIKWKEQKEMNRVGKPLVTSVPTLTLPKSHEIVLNGKKAGYLDPVSTKVTPQKGGVAKAGSPVQSSHNTGSLKAASHTQSVHEATLAKTGSQAQSLLLLSLLTVMGGLVLVAGRRRQLK